MGHRPCGGRGKGGSVPRAASPPGWLPCCFFQLLTWVLAPSDVRGDAHSGSRK